MPLKSPQDASHKSEEQEVSAAEDFSDIGESDEEILNQGNNGEQIAEPAPEDENESPAEDIGHNESSDSKVKESDLLEGISEEELDISDEEKEEKVKVADALGVDWSQLITPKEVKEDKGPSSFRKQWTPGAIFARIGIPKSFLEPGLYEQVIQKLKDEGDPVEILHPIAFVHAYRQEQLEKESAKNNEPKWHSWVKPKRSLDIY